MTDLLTVLPQLPTAPFSNVLPSLERSNVAVADLLTSDAADVAKSARLPYKEVCRLKDAVLAALSAQLEPTSREEAEAGGPLTIHENQEKLAGRSLRSNALDLEKRWHAISSLDEILDNALGGGFPIRYLTEVTGESGTGKTHLLLSLLLAVQLPPPRGLLRSAVYISTEAALSTTRLQQILDTHPLLRTSASSPPVSLSRVLTIQTSDLETQEHVLRFQLPLAIRRHKVGLVVIDSITANYRAEFERRGDPRDSGQATTANSERGGASMARRSASLIETAALLRDLAQEHDVAIVVANQVADRFSSAPIPHISVPVSTPTTLPLGLETTNEVPSASAPSGAGTMSSPLMLLDGDREEAIDDDSMTLDHQQRWFTGWGDEVPHRLGTAGMKTPSLGMVWANQLACRIALTRRLVRGPGGTGAGMRWRRHLKLVFAPWCADDAGTKGVEFSIEKQGLVGVLKEQEDRDKI